MEKQLISPPNKLETDLRLFGIRHSGEKAKKRDGYRNIGKGESVDKCGLRWLPCLPHVYSGKNVNRRETAAREEGTE